MFCSACTKISTDSISHTFVQDWTCLKRFYWKKQYVALYFNKKADFHWHLQSKKMQLTTSHRLINRSLSTSSQSDLSCVSVRGWSHSISFACRDQKLSGWDVLMDMAWCQLARPLMRGASVWRGQRSWRGGERGHLLTCCHGIGVVGPAAAFPASPGWWADLPAHWRWSMNCIEAESDGHSLLQTQQKERQ